MPEYIDIHSHVNFKAFDEDRDEVIKRALANNTWVINVGTQADTSKKAVELAHKYPEGVYAVVGLHPIHTGASFHDEKELGEGGKAFTSRGEVFDKEIYRKFLADPKTVAIGECGLDYYRLSGDSIKRQKEAFVAQIELANEFKKPLMLHIRNNPDDKTRNAYIDSLELLKKHLDIKSLPAGRRGDVHFFAGTKEEARMFLDFGFSLSFTGVITFTDDYDEVIKAAPLDMIMSETDSPYVAPVPYRGKRNEPAYVKEVVKKIALLKNLPQEEAARAILKNAKRVFGV